MDKIDCNSLEKILNIKNEFENQNINPDIILPLYLEVINTIYATDLNNQEREINKLKSNIDNLYDSMQDIINKLKNKEQ